MLKKNGFTLIEILIATTILFSMITVLSPIISDLHVEQHILRDKRIIANQLYEDMQPYIWSNLSIPAMKEEVIRDKTILFQFTQENQFIKGCAEWQNEKQQTEKICLYGLVH